MKAMNEETNELKKAISELGAKERMCFSYKWHNGLILSKDLRKSTGDNTFEFMPIPTIKSDIYLFKNSRRECVIIDNNGNVDVSDITIHPTFVRKSQQRLAKTYSMLESVGLLSS